MYYVYHIPKRAEWGCTNNLERRLKQLDYQFSDLDRVITDGNIDKAADMERDMNIEYGYGWNTSRDYRKQLERAYNSNKVQSKLKLKKAKIQGTILGNANLENGHMKKIQSLGGKAVVASDWWKETSAIGGYTQSQKIHTCPHCGKQGKGNGMYKHHFNNCKQNKNI